MEVLDCPCVSRAVEEKGVNKGEFACWAPNPVVYHHDHNLSCSFYLQITADVYHEQPGECLIFRNRQSEVRVASCMPGSLAADKRHMKYSCLKAVVCRERPWSSRAVEGKGVNKGMSAFWAPPNPVMYHHDHHLLQVVQFSAVHLKTYLQVTSDVYQKQPGECLMLKNRKVEVRVTKCMLEKPGHWQAQPESFECSCLQRLKEVDAPSSSLIL